MYVASLALTQPVTSWSTVALLFTLICNKIKSQIREEIV